MANYILSHTGEELDAAITKALSIGDFENKVVTPSLVEQIITASEGKTLDTVTVNAVTGSLLSSLDSNFTASNIANGVTIFGLTGTYSSGQSAIKKYIGSFNINDTSAPWPSTSTYIPTDLNAKPSNGMLAIHIGVQGTSNSFMQVFVINGNKEWESYAYAGSSSYTVNVSSQIDNIYVIEINVTTNIQNTTANYQIIVW